MDRLLDKGLEQLTIVVVRMGEIAQKSLSVSVSGYVTGKDVSETVHELSEILVMMTAEVEEKSFNLIAKYQPVASDLRTINSYMKIAYDFERYGRYAWDIAFLNPNLGALGGCEGWMQQFIREMSEKVLLMVKVSVDSLKCLDTELAKTVTKTEQEVDEMYMQYLSRLVEEAGVMNKCTISSVLAVRYLERIADHATYISESVVYVSTGEKVVLR
jgi:phosphate transport system protein